MTKILCIYLFTAFLFCTFLPSRLDAQTDTSFFNNADQFFGRYVKEGLVDYRAIVLQPKLLDQLVNQIKNFNPEEKDIRKAFGINAYNILVIKKVVENWPIKSPMHVDGFFETPDLEFSGRQTSLDNFEKMLLAEFADPRLHCALVCASRSCPPLAAYAYRPDELESQLDQQCTKVANLSQTAIQSADSQILAAKWLDWYRSDFKQTGGIIAFLNLYRDTPLSDSAKLQFAEYDWQLNSLQQNFTGPAQPYRTSILLWPGQKELKIFNQIYTQREFDGFEKLNSRDTYFSSFIQFLYGQNDNLNIGFDVVVKSNLLNDFANSSPFRTLQFKTFRAFQSFACDESGHNLTAASQCLTSASGRDSLRDWEANLLETTGAAGIAHIGPKLKFNPLHRMNNLSLQQTIYLPLQDDLDGRYISFTQLFYDKLIGSRFQLFSEASLFTTLSPEFEMQTFFKLFFSYFPANRWTIYATTTIPYEYGIGSKFFITPNFEVELLYTWLAPIERYVGFSRPMTFNFGIRILR